MVKERLPLGPLQPFLFSWNHGYNTFPIASSYSFSPAQALQPNLGLAPRPLSKISPVCLEFS